MSPYFCIKTPYYYFIIVSLSLRWRVWGGLVVGFVRVWDGVRFGMELGLHSAYQKRLIKNFQNKHIIHDFLFSIRYY